MTGSEFGIERTTLILRIGPGHVISPNHEMRFQAPGLPCSILDDRIGETIVLGASDVPGIWTCYAKATLSGYEAQGILINVRLEDIRSLPDSVDIVTSGDPRAVSHMVPYALDVVPTSELELLIEGRAYVQPPARTMMVQETGESRLARRTGVDESSLARQRPEAVYRVAQSYGWRCAFTGMHLSAPGGDDAESLVIRVDEPRTQVGGAITGCLFASRTLAECYANGLLAIGDDHDIVRHRTLSAEIRTLLDVVNPKALLFLPEERSHWPSLELARVHRLKSGL